MPETYPEKLKRDEELTELVREFQELSQQNGIRNEYKKRRLLTKIVESLVNDPRLKALKNSLYAKHGSDLKEGFNECYKDALQEAQLIICKKINQYDSGSIQSLVEVWSNFSEQFILAHDRDEAKQVLDILQERITLFSEEAEKQLKDKKSTNLDSCQKLKQLCQDLCAKLENLVKSQPLDNLQSSFNDFVAPEWQTFLENLKTLRLNQSVYNWFQSYLRFRFLDAKNDSLGIIRRSQNLIIINSTDQTGDHDNNEQGENLLYEASYDKYLKEENQQNINSLREILQQDPYNIFKKRHIDGYPEINFSAVVRCKLENMSWAEIGEHFDNVVSGQRTISPFYSRSLVFFKPILREYSLGQIALNPEIIETIIREEKFARPIFNRKSLSLTNTLSFRDIVVQRQSQSWQSILIDNAESLTSNEVDVSELILFYLDKVHKFKLGEHLISG